MPGCRMQHAMVPTPLRTSPLLPLPKARPACSVSRQFVTGPADEVVPESGVRAFAEAIQRMQPARAVTVASMGGNHCRHYDADNASYLQAVRALLKDAGVVSGAVGVS